jgi:hypothetical protein
MGDSSRNEDPELVRSFVHTVTPPGLENQLKDALAEEIRRLARSLRHTEVYACRTGGVTAQATPAVVSEKGSRTMPPGPIRQVSGDGASARVRGAPGWRRSEGDRARLGKERRRIQRGGGGVQGQGTPPRMAE